MHIYILILWSLISLVGIDTLFSVFNEHLIARHIFFHSFVTYGEIVNLGKCPRFIKSSIGLYYVKVEYNYLNQKYTSYILRRKNDVIGRKILIAINTNKSNIAVRYNYEPSCKYYGWAAIFLFAPFIYPLYIFGISYALHYIIIFIIIVILNYMFLPYNHYFMKRSWEKEDLNQTGTIEKSDMIISMVVFIIILVMFFVVMNS